MMLNGLNSEVFDVASNLVLTKHPDEVNGNIVEECIKIEPELKGFYVCFPDERLNAVKEYITQHLHGSQIKFCISTLEKDSASGLRMLSTIEKMKSFTEQFIDYYGGVQEILDIFSEVEAQLAVDSDARSVPADYLEEFGDYDAQTTTSKQDNYEDTNVIGSQESATNSNSEIDYNYNYNQLPQNLENQTREYESNSYSYVNTDQSNSAPYYDISNTGQQQNNNVEYPPMAYDGYYSYPMMPGFYPAVACTESSAEMEELMTMVRGIAERVGVVSSEDHECLSLDDLMLAQDYVNSLPSSTMREAFVAVIGSATTEADRKAVSIILQMFIQYIYDNDLER